MLPNFLAAPIDQLCRQAPELVVTLALTGWGLFAVRKRLILSSARLGARIWRDGSAPSATPETAVEGQELASAAA